MSKTTGNRSLRTVHPPRIRTVEEIEAEHFAAWAAWLKGLTPDERAQLEGNPLLSAPPQPRARKRARRVEEDEETPGLGTCDHLASSNLDPCEALMAKEEREAAEGSGTLAAIYEIDDTTRRDLYVLGHVLPEIVDAEDPRLMASLMALALGIGPRQGITIKGLAERHGLRSLAVLAAVAEWQEKFKGCPASLTLLRLVISPVVASRNPRLEAETIALAARFSLSGGQSMTKLGEHHGVCKAAISARVRRWAARLGLALPRDCKEETANYVLFNVRRQKSKTFAE